WHFSSLFILSSTSLFCPNLCFDCYTYSMGAVCGAIETIQGKRYRPKHTESVLRGGTHDLFEMSLIG
ncbi:MAG: hypothetical protein AAFQ41_04605, partial [Cyanobacteria bacterium J06623_7]